MSKKIDKGPCDGCGKALFAHEMAYNTSSNFAEGEIAPGVLVHVCTGRGSRRYSKNALDTASTTCLAAARRKHSVCCGCGTRVSNFAAEPLCKGCRDALERAKTMDASSGTVQPRGIAAHGLFPYLDSGQQMEIARLLARVAAGPRRHNVDDSSVFRDEHVERINPGGGGLLAADPIVEMDDAQAEAMERLAKLFYEHAQAQANDGFQRGNDLLARLASGDLTVPGYNDAARRRR